MAESISRSSIHNRKAAEFEAAPPPGILQKVVHGATFQTYPIGLGTAAVYISLSNLKWHPDFITSIGESIRFFLRGFVGGAGSGLS